MGAAVSITRLDLTASDLRKAARREKDSGAARRILALALVLDGVDRKTAAETCGMDRQTLRDWVHRYNAAGLAGLRNLKSPGPGSKLTARQQAELAELVLDVQFRSQLFPPPLALVLFFLFHLLDARIAPAFAA